MQKAIIVFEKRLNLENKSDDQFDNYGKCIVCQHRRMPEKDCVYVQLKIQEIIYRVRPYGINHSFQTASLHFPGTPLSKFKVLIKPCKEPYNIPGGFIDYLNNSNL